jgi:hypothetical protein
MTLTAEKLPNDLVPEPTAIDWHHFLHPGKPDEPDELFDEELERR